MIERRGAAHLEMIMSFMLFVGFVFFLFFFLSPYKTNVIQETLVDDVYNSFKEQSYTNLTTMFLKMESENPRCFTVDISGAVLNYNLSEIIAYSASNEKKKADISNNQISVEGNDKFFNLFISPIFSSDSLSGCRRTSNFSLGSIIERQILTYPKIVELSNEYISNYSNLKEKLLVPQNYDFAIISEELGISMEQNIPEDVEVLSRSYVDEILYDNATIINVEFVVKIW